jgi:hypothetical protein
MVVLGTYVMRSRGSSSGLGTTLPGGFGKRGKFTAEMDGTQAIDEAKEVDERSLTSKLGTVH